MGTRRGQLLTIAVIVMLLTVVGAIGVSAHAELKTSDPADKATLNKAPTQIVITFTEETNPTKSGGSVTDASGATASTGFKVDLNERTKMTIDLKPSLPNGVYTVKWNSFTDDDSGMADGTFSFTIQAQATGTGTATTGTAPAVGSATAVAPPAQTTSAPAVTPAPTATVSATATRAATTPAATGTGGGSAVATSAPATLPKTGNGERGSGIPWLVWLTLSGVAALVAGGVIYSWRSAHRA